MNKKQAKLILDGFSDEDKKSFLSGESGYPQIESMEMVKKGRYYLVIFKLVNRAPLYFIHLKNFVEGFLPAWVEVNIAIYKNEARWCFALEVY